MRAQKVFIIESHPVLRDSYAFLLGRQDDLDVCGVTGSVARAASALQETSPDLILVNFIPGDDGRGLSGIRTLSEAHPDARILVVSSRSPDVHAAEVREVGACVFMHRDRVPFELLTCVREILSTSQRLDATACNGSSSSASSSSASSSSASSSSASSSSASSPGVSSSDASSLEDDASSNAPDRTAPRLQLPLDEREHEVFRFLGMGMTLPEVAARLNVDASEVRRRRSRIMDTLHLASPHDLALFARQWLADDARNPMTRSQPEVA